jgi:hypothetical protein
MNDLSPAFAAESLTVNIIEELREQLESTGSYEKQLGLITEMEENYYSTNTDALLTLLLAC